MNEVLIKSFVSSGGRHLVDDWLNGQRAVVRAAFLNIMTALRDQPRSEWTRPDYGVLRRDCQGFGEVRFKVQNVEHRPIGFFLGDEVFVLVVFATERDSQFDPPTACEIARKRRQNVRDNPRYSDVCDF